MRKPTSTKIRAALALGIVLGLSSVHTLASWSDAGTLTTAPIQSGGMDILLNGSESITLNGMSDMVPNSAIAQNVTVSRPASSIPFTYDITSTATNPANAFTQGLRVKVYAGSATSGTTCGGTQIAGGTTGAAVTGTVGTGLTGLRTATSQNLCVLLSLNGSTPSTAQGQSSVVTLTFTAKQVAP